MLMGANLPGSRLTRSPVGSSVNRPTYLAPLLLDGRRGGEDDGGFVEAPYQLQRPAMVLPEPGGATMWCLRLGGLRGSHLVHGSGADTSERVAEPYL